MGTEHAISITRIKLNYLFKNIRKLGGAKNALADKLNISYTIFDNYLKWGKDYIEKYKDMLGDILDLDTEFLEENFELKKYEVKEDFLNKTEEAGISDRNRGAFDVFYYDAMCKHTEQYIYEYQKNVIENTIFETDEDLNEKIKILMQFRLIYDRAQLSITEEDIYLKHKFTKSSSKHVGVVIKDLERRCPEDFAMPEKEKEAKTQLSVTFGDIFAWSSHLEEIHPCKQIEQKEDVIDVEYEKDGD